MPDDVSTLPAKPKNVCLPSIALSLSVCFYKYLNMQFPSPFLFHVSLSLLFCTLVHVQKAASLSAFSHILPS